MKIAFILPGTPKVPVGGYKIVYEYADLLARNGHWIDFLYIIDLPFIHHRKPIYLKSLYYKFKNFEPKWFEFNEKVNHIIIRNLNNKKLNKYNIIIATAWQTAYILKSINTEPKKYYFIQHYEIWSGYEKLVNDTYLDPSLKNIVIAKWLKKTIEKIGGEVISYIPNGLDFDKFKLQNNIENRNPNSICMMYHKADWKGSKDGLMSIKLVKKKYPEIKFTVFSVFPKSKCIPDWIEYIHNPTQKELIEIYNNHAIFISPSLAEGWPLPPAEALACGCSVVCTDIGGHREYAIHEQTALLSPPRDPGELATNIIRLVGKQDYRKKLAFDGNRYIQQFTKEKAVTSLKKVLHLPI